MPVSTERRRELAEEGKMACPKTLNYPLDTEKHVINAMVRYNQEHTVKCKGGMKRICKAYKEHGLTENPAYKEHCKVA